MKKISVWASGSGSNAENLIGYFKDKPNAQVVEVLTNRKSAGVIERANRLNIPCHYFPKSEFESGIDLIKHLQSSQIDLIVLAGFLLRVPEAIIQAYRNRIINIHPALLPAYGGQGMYGMKVHESVIAAGEKHSGISIHLVDEQFDHGKIIVQKSCPILSTDTAITLAEKIHQLEYEHFPKAVADYLEQQ